MMLIGSAKRWLLAWSVLFVLSSAGRVCAQAPGAVSPRPNLVGNIERPLRYRPDDGDFAITNGAETFNRPLYGRNTAFRVDGGDKPEFVMYLPGRGGNLRIGVRQGAQARWLIDAASIATRYRPGELLYEIRDPLLGTDAILHLHLLALRETDGLILEARLEAQGVAPAMLELIAAFGGVNGERGARDGDIGTERVPISQWFKLQPEFCAGNQFMLDANGFELRNPAAHIAAVLPPDARLSTADARKWNDIDGLLGSAGGAYPEPVVVAQMPLKPGPPQYLALQILPGGERAAAELDTYRDVSGTHASAPPSPRFAARYSPRELPRLFARTRADFQALRGRVSVKSPDPFIDTAVGALDVAADALWDEPQQAFMHGAIAWRTQLLGWRGPYALDALGWQERARRHFSYWAARQNVDAIPAQLPPAEEATHLARNPVALHSNGDLSNSHYDMNLVYVDALFRHLLWTGDRVLARALWPVIVRHLAWERRLFRREFGPDKLPLYEAYAAIWASDDLQYHGGGVTHASAYNFWHNAMAARVAHWLGEDATVYEGEAALIQRAMNEYLWLPEQGMFAEYRDYLGLQRAHPAAALWSFYHVLDAGNLVTARQAEQMAQYVETALPRIPVRGPGVEGDFHVFSTSHWLPYTWSTNNVVMGENLHTALGLWQAGRADAAFTLFKSALLASMYMGISPGNVGSMNYLDVYRRESQRDFADGAGVMSRALVEGLFGLEPDALAGTLTIHPGWPAQWMHAALHTPTVALAYRRDGARDRYVIGVGNAAITRARMRLRMTHERARVTLRGRAVAATVMSDELGGAWLTFEWPLAGAREIVVEWQGAARADAPAGGDMPKVAPVAAGALPVEPDLAGAKFTSVDLSPFFNDRVTQIFQPGKYLSPRSPFVSLAMPSQGIGAWAGHVNASAGIDDSGLRRAAADGPFTLPNGVPFATPGPGATPNVVFTSQWDNYPRSVTVPLRGRARFVYLLMAGSTNHMQSQFDNGEVVVEYADGSRQRLALHNPTNWWPIDQDYFIDDFQFRRPEPIPPRVDLKTGRARMLDPQTFAGHGGPIDGGAASVLSLTVDPQRELHSLMVTALANEVVVGLMAVTLIK
jgi:Domain of unknown function (DUF4450)